jgi:maltose O-acetyltransferase
MKSCGKNFQVASNVYLGSLTELKVGNDVFIAHSNVIIALRLTIGDEVLIGPNCVISAGNHQFDGKSFRFKKPLQGEVIIEGGSWVAANCTLVSGSKLPARSILAAGAVLNKQFETENSIYAGIPAKFIKTHTT